MAASGQLIGAAGRSVSAETELLLLCARAGDFSPHLRETVQSPELGWDAFLAAASENYVEPLVASRLERAASDLLPPAIVDRLRKIKFEAAARALRLAGEMLRITAAFGGASGGRRIRAIPYKGLVLAAQAYGDLALRRFDDLDFVLPHEDLPGADHALRDIGYEPAAQAFSHFRGTAIQLSRKPFAPIPGEYVYRHSANGAFVELHTECTLRHFPKRADLDQFGRRVAAIALDGGPGGAERQLVQTFCPEDMLVFLAVHGTKDLWARLAWVADIAHMIRAHPRMDWNAVLSRAEEVRAQRMVLLAVALAADLLGEPIPAEVRARVRREGAVTEFARLFARAFRAGIPAQLATLRRFHYRRRMVRGWMRGWAYALRLTLAPAEEDWASVRLPRALAPAYALLRPLRLRRKYRGAVGQRSN